jgi:hypothetical protein
MPNRILTPAEAAKSLLEAVEREAAEQKLTDSEKRQLWRAIAGSFMAMPMQEPPQEVVR